MGMRFSAARPETRLLTQEEKDHLLLLGITAGCLGIMNEAMESGDIFDPKHMEKAQLLKTGRECGIELLSPLCLKEAVNG